MARRIDIRYKAGDTRGITVQITDENGAVDLTSIAGGTGDIEFGIFRDSKRVSNLVKKTFTGGGITITTASTGTIQIALLRSDTVELEKGYYPYEISLITDASTEGTVLEGLIILERSRLK